MASDRPLPSGVVSFVMTDIEGSTTLLRSLGPDYPEVLERHRAVLRGVWDDHDGVEVDAEGDSFLVAFVQPADAVAAAADALRRVDSEEWGPMPVRIRVGSHLGPAKPRNGRYAALAVHQTARITEAANGGQALLSPQFAAQARRAWFRHATADGEVEPFRIVDLGRYRIRDFEEPITVFALQPPGVPPVSTPPRAKPAELHNLPNATTDLVGRLAELDRLEREVVPGRVVTLLGAGGVGKTKVAVEFARLSMTAWPDGAWLVQLAPLHDERSVVEAIAKSISISLSGAGDPKTTLTAALRDRRCLLVLDNCEHVRLAAGRVADAIRRSCATVAILTTSRIPLGLGGEHIVRVGPLRSGVDDDGPAVELFEARASDIDATASWPRDIIAALCDRLDGLPLAIELAAARTDAIRPVEILEMLEMHDSVLRSDDPTAEARHRSLDATIDWSYDLLSTAEQTTLRRLSVYATAFDLDDAVAAASRSGVEHIDIANHLWTLVADSMLTRLDRDGASRYMLLSTVRHHLRVNADATEIAEAARGAATSLDARIGPDNRLDAGWMHRTHVELENIRGLVADVDALDVGLRMRLVWAIGQLHDADDQFAVGIAELHEATAGVQACPELVGALVQLANLHLRLGDLAAAESVIDQAAAHADAVGEADWERGGIAQIRADIALRRGQFSVADEYIDHALANGPAPRVEAWLWSTRGFERKADGEPSEAVQAFERACARWEGSGTTSRLAKAYADLAGALASVERFDEAVATQLKSLSFAEEFRQSTLIAFSALMAARVSARLGDWRTAVELTAAAELLIAEGHVVQYHSDREPRIALIEDARRELGTESVSAAERTGLAFAPGELKAVTKRVLTAADQSARASVPR